MTIWRACQRRRVTSMRSGRRSSRPRRRPTRTGIWSNVCIGSPVPAAPAFRRPQSGFTKCLKPTSVGNRAGRQPTGSRLRRLAEHLAGFGREIARACLASDVSRTFPDVPAGERPPLCSCWTTTRVHGPARARARRLGCAVRVVSGCRGLQRGRARGPATRRGDPGCRRGRRPARRPAGRAFGARVRNRLAYSRRLPRRARRFRGAHSRPCAPAVPTTSPSRWRCSGSRWRWRRRYSPRRSGVITAYCWWTTTRRWAPCTATTLGARGIRLTVVNDPLQAMAAIATAELELILLDMRMPGCTGSEAGRDDPPERRLGRYPHRVPVGRDRPRPPARRDEHRRRRIPD